MAPSQSRILLEDRMTVKSMDSSKFEKVTRISGRSAAFDAELTIDINTNVYPLKEGQVLTFAFADQGKESLMEDYEYVCLGRVFHEDDKSAEKRAVYISFGGLLCQLIADKAIVSEFTMDKRLFFFLRRST
ncbi:putative RNA polymerase subunit [Gregarina niphandrodes]|uniref:DNA-directed RNA polymerases I, II, and III subunit RPABC3 n=1 Tax=Gregarina niphandrodes TaxID=110365 RepID=A0A023B4I3_GRENI|nr:putative RNA polymerase subunit [Gregarina niphandrodes]EZG56793.1 putative RNA polymerase subunit [Gregarina niphandrodes]|eukprot:XP_011131159.1 putative RNA polymerase subunit [Gregarina niphandrodes]